MKDMIIFGGQSERNQQPLHDVWSLATGDISVNATDVSTDQVIQPPSKLQLLSVDVSQLYTQLTGLRVAMRPDCNEAFVDPALQHPYVLVIINMLIPAAVSIGRRRLLLLLICILH